MVFTSIFNGYPDLTPFMPLELKTLCVISFILNIFVNWILKSCKLFHSLSFKVFTIHTTRLFLLILKSFVFVLKSRVISRLFLQKSPKVVQKINNKNGTNKTIHPRLVDQSTSTFWAIMTIGLVGKLWLQRIQKCHPQGHFP